MTKLGGPGLCSIKSCLISSYASANPIRRSVYDSSSKSVYRNSQELQILINIRQQNLRETQFTCLYFVIAQKYSFIKLQTVVTG